MKTTQAHDFFAPLLGRDLSGSHQFSQTISPRPASFQLGINEMAFELDPVDRFTYIIMGLAIMISIVIPVLNWN